MYGHELTFIPTIRNWDYKKYKEKFENGVVDGNFLFNLQIAASSANYSKMNEIEKRLNEVGAKVINVGKDPDVIEINTSPIKSKKKALENIKKIRHVMENEFGYMYEDVWSGGGGNHIHVDTHKDVKKNVAVFGFVSKFHVVAWGFNNPAMREMGVEDAIANIDFEYKTRYGNKVSDIIISRINSPYPYSHMFESKESNMTMTNHSHGKESNIEGDDETIEFRFFKVAKTMQEQKDHIDFVDALVKFAHKNVDQCIGYIDELFSITNRHGKYRDNLTKMTLKTALTQWDEMISLIGLDVERYSAYKENIEQRFLFAEQYKNQEFLV